MVADMRRRGMCHLMKPDGTSSVDGGSFICDQCNQDAAKFLEIREGLYGRPESSGATWDRSQEDTMPTVGPR